MANLESNWPYEHFLDEHYWVQSEVLTHGVFKSGSD